MICDNTVRFQWFFLLPRYWLLWLGVVVSFFLSLLPLSIILRIGKCLGRLFYVINARRVQIARVNLINCYSNHSSAQTESLLQRHCESVGMGVLEVCIAWWWSKERLEKKITIEGLENLSDSTTRGTLLLVMHFTTMELAGAAIALKRTLDATYATHRNAVYEYMQNKLRTNHCKEGRMLDRKNLRSIIKSLRSGRIVWYAPDQDYGKKHSKFVNFFGISAATVFGTPRLSRLGNAAVVPMTLLRKPKYQGYILRVYPQFSSFPTENEIEDLQRVNNFVEACVRENPEQYMWIHRRFKTRPDGEPTFY